MAKNIISVNEQIEKQLDVFINKLKTIDSEIIKISQSARNSGKGLFDVKSPNQLNSSLKERSNTTQQLNAYLKEKVALEKALIRETNKLKLSEQGISDALVKQRYERQQLNAKAKEAAVLSSKLSSEYQKQSAKLNILRKKYKDLALTKGENSKAAKKLLRDITALDKRLKRIDANVGQFQRSVGNYGKALKSAGRAARQMAGAMGFVGGAFLAFRVVSDAFNRIRQFDKEMQNMAGILRKTRPELKQIEDRIIKVASVSIKTSNEVAQLATSLFTLGKTEKEVLNLIEPVNNLSIALGATSEETGEFLVQVLNSFGAGSEEAEKYADTIAAIRTSTSLDFQKMRDSFQYITPISKILNKDLEYTGAVVGVLADNGLKAESAGRLLATAQIKLATQGRTLQEALDELNQAYLEGKDGVELLEIANESFGKQAAKIGVVLATQQDRLAEYEKKIRESAGALDDLVGQQLESLDAKLKITTSTWEQFVLSLENGEGALSNALKSGLDVINNILNGLRILNLTTEEYSNSLKDDIVTQKYKEIKKAIEEAGGLTEEQAIKEADIYRDKVDNIQSELDALMERDKYLRSKSGLDSEFLFDSKDSQLSKNKEKIVSLTQDIAFYTANLKVLEDMIAQTDETQKESNKTLVETESVVMKSISAYRGKISEARKVIESIDLEQEGSKELIKQKQELIDNYQREIDALLGTNKARKKGIETLEGSLKSYEAIISKLEDEQSRLATSGREWQAYEEQIKNARYALAAFRAELEGVQNVLNNPSFEEAAKNIEDILTKKPEKIDLLGMDDFEDDMARRTEQLKKAQEIEIEIARETAALKKQLEQDIFDSTTAIIGNLFDAKAMRYDEDIQRNNDYYARLLDNEQLSEEQREALEAERDRKNAQIEKKKREVQRKAAIFEKVAASTKIIIDTTQKVAAIKAQAALLLANPLTAPLAGQALAQIPFVIATGALALGQVASAPIPQYEKGKGDYDNYEGMAIWGEKRREVKISKNGNIEISPRKIGNHLTHVKKDDVIHPDANKFFQDEIAKYAIYASINNQNASLDQYIIAKSYETTLKQQTDRMIKAVEKSKPKINVYNQNRISEDLAFMFKKQNTL